MLGELDKKISEGLETEDRKDIEFRTLIALSEVSDIVKYITHDQKLNPNARPYGCKEDEKLAYGQLLVQLAIIMYMREINFKESLKIGLKHWLGKEWKKNIKNLNPLCGNTASKGIVKGRAVILKGDKDLEKIEMGDIAVMDSAFMFPLQASQKLGGIIVNHGGILCHSAILAREFEIPCIVSVANATELIPENKIITLNANEGRVILE